MSTTKTGFFKVEEVAGQPIAQAVTALGAENAAQFAEVDWSKVPFTYEVHDTKEEALKGYSDKDLLDLLNGVEKANAKSKEYQRITKPFRPDPKDPEVKRAQMIKEFVNTFKVDEKTATDTVDALIASGKAG